MTVQELHIALDQTLQKINSNWKQQIRVQEKDIALNSAVKTFIETRASAKGNAKGEGFEDTQKRYDDLKGLKRTFTENDYVFVDSNDLTKQYVYLPADYLKLVSCFVDLEYNCHNVTTVNSTVSQKHFTIPVPLKANYGTFKIQLDGTSPITLFDSSMLEKSNAAITYDLEYFTYLELMIEKLIETAYYNGLKIRVSYQKENDYSKSYSKYPLQTPTVDVGRYIIVTVIGSTADIEYAHDGSTFITADLASYEESQFDSVTNNLNNRATELRSSADIDDVLNSYYHSKNRHKKPIITLESNRLVIYRDTTFKIKNVRINYLKNPKIISLPLDQTSELDNWDEIVLIAAKQLSAKIHDPAYQILNNEVNTVE